MKTIQGRCFDIIDKYIAHMNKKGRVISILAVHDKKLAAIGNHCYTEKIKMCTNLRVNTCLQT